MAFRLPPFPIEVTITEPTPIKGLVFIKKDKAKPMEIKLKIESAAKIYMTKTNIAGCQMDVKALMRAFQISETDIDNIVNYVRSYVDRLDIVVTAEAGTNTFKIILPNVLVDRLRDVEFNGKHIDFSLTDNQLEFTVTHSSTDTITLVFTSTTTEMMATTTNMVVSIVILFVLLLLIRSIIQAVRRT